MTWKDVPKNIVLLVAENCEGRGISMLEKFTQMGAPPELIERAFEAVESGGGLGQQLYDVDERPVNQLAGVIEYNLIHQIGDDLGVSGEPKIGRGSKCRSLCEAIRRYCESQT